MIATKEALYYLSAFRYIEDGSDDGRLYYKQRLPYCCGLL